MLGSDIDWFLGIWHIGEYRIFKYTEKPVTEYVKIMRSSKEIFLIDGSSTVFGLGEKLYSLTIEEITQLMSKELLHEVLISSKSPRELKTGGRECGSWSLGSDYPHTFWCPLNKSPWQS